MDLKKIGFEDERHMGLVQDRFHWPALEISVLGFRVLLPQSYIANWLLGESVHK
jgi:hypothetical protein